MSDERIKVVTFYIIEDDDGETSDMLMEFNIDKVRNWQGAAAVMAMVRDAIESPLWVSSSFVKYCEENKEFWRTNGEAPETEDEQHDAPPAPGKRFDS